MEVHQKMILLCDHVCIDGIHVVDDDQDETEYIYYRFILLQYYHNNNPIGENAHHKIVFIRLIEGDPRKNK